MTINYIALYFVKLNFLAKKMARFSLIIAFLIMSIGQCWPVIAFAENRVVDLKINYKTVNFSGKTRKAIAINDQIPAPTLHFKQGDHVVINVHNNLDEGTAIHWHGVLVPWQMDGVEGISQKAILPGNVFRYEFTLEQSGTYWYHAHAGVQEQEGLYGAFVIDPPHAPAYQYTKDYVIVLSDWSNIPAKKIFANLKKTGDYFSPNFPLQPSLIRFIHDYNKANFKERQAVINDYMMMQHMRMSIYDISDVAYNAFLLNGQPKTHPWTAPVKVGDVVRLKFIGASGSTIFRVKIPGTTMQMVHIQGNDVEPYSVNDFTIAPGETYDVLVKIQKDNPYIIYAESSDTLGAAYGALVTDPCQNVDYQHVIPFPEPLPTTRKMMMNMMMSGDHRAHSMAQETSHSVKMGTSMQIADALSLKQAIKMAKEMTIGKPMPINLIQAKTTGTKYQHLRAAIKTNDPNKPIEQIIRMDLFGWMDHFIWMINGVTEDKAQPILIKPGKRYRIVFTNNSMMHHPMHIHGHWFILRNGQGAFDPLLHTIDMAPGATAIADFDADASGQWFFHCHHLYHMMSGMGRVFQYNTIINIAKCKEKPEKFFEQQPYINRPIIREDIIMPLDRSLITHPMAHLSGLYLANFLDIGEDPFHNKQQITFKGLYGGDFNKLELYSDDAEINKGKIENADVDIFYWHLIDQFLAIKGGVNYFYRPAKTPYWQPGIGVEGLMPYFIDTNFRTYYHRNSLKLDVELSRDSQITNNFFIRTAIRSILATSAVMRDEIGSGLNQMRYTVRPYYRLMPGLAVFVEYEYDAAYGSLKNIRVANRKSTKENTLMLGFSILF